jgi:F-type H+-transporting ATPase subunit delta
VGDSRRAWARALFLALPAGPSGEGAREAAARALEGASRILGSDAEAEAFFTDPAIPNGRKAESLALLYGEPGSDGAAIFGRFAALLVEGKRIDLIPAIALAFRSILDREDGVARIELSSARPMSAGKLGEIKDAWRSVSGARRVFVSETIDPGLLGGFVLRSGSIRYDWSTKGRLERLRKKLSQPLESLEGRQ